MFCKEGASLYLKPLSQQEKNNSFDKMTVSPLFIQNLFYKKEVYK